MQTTFKFLFDIYPDKISKGAVVGYRKADGTPLVFPCTLDTGDAVKDAKGRWTASGLGLKPVIAKYSGTLERTTAVEAWIGDGFCKDPNAEITGGNKTLERVRFVDGVTEIGFGAFVVCTELTGIAIPDTVTSIGKYAFWGCTDLTSVEIPEGVTTIGDWAFAGCYNLTSITIPESVTEIGAWTFWGCRRLTDIAIPEGVTSIEFGAFDGCYSLTKIRIPGTVTEIRNCAFQDCKYLTDITIPNSVTEIGYSVFRGCRRLNVYVDQPESDLLDKADLLERCTIHWKQAEAV